MLVIIGMHVELVTKSIAHLISLCYQVTVSFEALLLTDIFLAIDRW